MTEGSASADRGFIDVSASFGPDAGRSRGRPLSAMLAEQRSHGVHLSLAHSRVAVHYATAVEVLEVAQRHEHLYVETSAMAHFDAIETAVARIGHERVLFGSGGPGRAMQSPLNAILLAEIDDPAKRAILAGNAARLL